MEAAVGYKRYGYSKGRKRAKGALMAPDRSPTAPSRPVRYLLMAYMVCYELYKPSSMFHTTFPEFGKVAKRSLDSRPEFGEGWGGVKTGHSDKSLHS